MNAEVRELRSSMGGLRKFLFAKGLQDIDSEIPALAYVWQEESSPSPLQDLFPVLKILKGAPQL